MKLKFLLVFLVLFLLNVSGVFAIGISAVDLNMKLDYEEGLTKNLEYFIGSKTTETVKISKNGALAPYIDVLEGEFSGDSFTAILSLTEELNPGWSEVNICVEDYDPDKEQSGSVYAKTKSCAKVSVFTLHDGKKPTVSFSAKQGIEEVEFNVNLKNYGREVISQVIVNYDVYNSEGELAGIVTGTGENVGSKEEIEIIGTFPFLGNLPGDYTVKANIKADNEEEIVKQSSFRIGEMVAELNEYQSVVGLGGIQLISFPMENKWPGELEVYLELSVEGNTVKSHIDTIDGFKTKDFSLYLDTSGFDEKEYDAVLAIYINGVKVSEEDIKLTFSTEAVVTGDQNEVKLDSEESNSGLNLYLILGGVVVLVLIVGLTLLYYNREDSDEEDDDF